MTKKKPVKRALISSLLILTMCFTMLVGSTFAWFTDSVTSAGNRIVSGNLKVDLLMHKGDSGYVSIAGGEGDIFKEAGVAQDSTETLWEPGKTQIVYLGVKNLGTLALKYNIWIRSVSLDEEVRLTEAFEYAIIDGLDYAAAQAQLGSVSSWEAVKAVQGVQTGTVTEGDYKVADNGFLDEITSGVENETDYFVLAIHMKEEAGNEYQNKRFVFDVCVVAGQATAEEDSFDNLYDDESEYGDYVVYSSAQLAGVIAHVNNSPSEKRVNIAMGDDFVYANEPINITNGKIVKLDLAGHNLTVDNSRRVNGINISDGATLTLTNSKDTGSYTFNGTSKYAYAISVLNDVDGQTTTLNIKDVTVNVHADQTDSIYAVAESGDAVINIEDGAVINITGADKKTSAVKVDSGATVNMNGGTVNVNVTGSNQNMDAVGILVWSEKYPDRYATLNINGGTINVTGGGTFAQCVQTGNSGSTGNVVNMTGGTINVTGQDASAFGIAGNANITVSGGSINVGVDAGYEGYGFRFQHDQAPEVAVQLKDGVVTLHGDNNVLTNAPGRVKVISE